MATNTTQIDPEGLVQLLPQLEASHPFAKHLEKFRSDVSHWLHDRNKILEAKPGERMLTRTLFRGILPPEGQWALKWIYFSAQYWSKRGFRAVTFLYRTERAATSVYEFPKDPRLHSLAAYFSEQITRKAGDNILQGAEVLRYVPRRRLTFLDKKGVGKFLREFETVPLWNKLKRLQAQIYTEHFQFAKVTHLDDANNLLYQTHQSGRDLAELLSKQNCESHLSMTGKIHSSIHKLNFRAESVWDSAGFINKVRQDVAWIGLFSSELESSLSKVLSRWIKKTPDLEPSKFAFCHGDFRTPHLLVMEKAPWSVIDFDGYLMADPAWEAASFLTSLKRDVPFYKQTMSGPAENWQEAFEKAERSYLQGYFSHCDSPFALSRLAWFRIGTEIHYLARSFQRNLVHPLSLQRTRSYIETLSEKIE